MKCFVSTSYVNAWSIRRGLRRLGLECRSLDPGGGLVPPAPEPPGRDDVVFFTEENSLMLFLAGRTPGCRFQPRSVAVSPDDKLAFADAMRGIGESPVPYWPLSPAPSEVPPVRPVVVKCRYSWRDGRKLDRGYVCSTDAEYAAAFRRLAADGLGPEDFFLQEFLSGAGTFSTSGFFDAENQGRNLILVTRKAVGHGGRLPTGVVVETVADPAGLVPRTVAILATLGYRGPFELEFVHDRRRDAYHVLELNMRFWMQHGLFVDCFDNQLIVRYLDRDLPTTAAASPLPGPRLVWVDGVAVCDALAMFRWRMLGDILRTCWPAWWSGARIVMHPDPWSTLCFRSRWAARKVGALLRRFLPAGT